MDTDALRPELVGQVSAGRLQRRLDGAHDVVVRNNPVRAIVAHGEHRTTVGHHGRGKLCHPHERVAGDVHRLRKAFGRAIEQSALEVAFRGKGDGMHQDIEATPSLPDEVEHGFELPGHGNIKRGRDRRLKFLRQGLDVSSRLVVEPSDGELGAGRTECLGAAVSDRVIIGDTDDQGLCTGKHRTDRVSHGQSPILWFLPRWRVAPLRPARPLHRMQAG